MSLALQLFGSVQVTWADVPLKFATDHSRALLVYLAVEANVNHSRATVAALLWPEEGEEKARRNLRQALFFLKQTLRPVNKLADYLQILPATLRWTNHGVAVDLHTFQQHWHSGQTHAHTALHHCPQCIAQLTEAVTLYRGEFLSGLLLRENQLFEEWALFLREQSHRQVVTMLDALTTHHLAAGNYEQAGHYAARQVALEPWHEEGHRQLMRALAAQGQPGAALRQYEQCRQLLQQELGIPPAPETTLIYEQIRLGKFVQEQAQQPIRQHRAVARMAAAPPALHNLPTSLAPLVGRSEQLAALRTCIDHKSDRLLTIVGMGGMGKSRLALALLEQLAAESPPPFVHGLWFIPVSGVPHNTEHLADALAAAVLKAVGVTTPTDANLAAALFHYLADRQLLLVFDNFEHLLVAEESATLATQFLLTLLQAAPGAVLVITSRLPLQLLSETVLRLEGLIVPPSDAKRLDKRDLANYESVRLFVYHAQRILPDFALDDETLPGVLELCHSLSGMPLAIELAAALMPHFTPDELVSAIRQNLSLLVSQRRDLDIRHRHLSATLESSWQLLSPREQSILAQSSIFVGAFSRAAAQAVTGATVSELASLVDQSLLQQAGVGIYQLHDLLCQFARAKLYAATPNTSVAERHSLYYLTFIAARERMLARNQTRQAVEEIQREIDNVQQAWQWAINHAQQRPTTATIHQQLAASVYALWHFYLIVGLFAEGAALFQQTAAAIQTILGQSTEVEPQPWQHLRSKLLAYEAYLRCLLGNYPGALSLAQQAVALGRAYEAPEGELIGLLVLMMTHHRSGAVDEAKLYAQQTLQRAQQVPWAGEPAEYYYDVQSIVYIYLGAIALVYDEYAQAQCAFTQALDLCQRQGKLRGELNVRLNLANLMRHQHRYAAAHDEYQQVLQLVCKLGYRQGEALARYELAEVLRRLGEYTAAQQQFALATASFHEIGETYHKNYAQVDVGLLYAYLGDFDQARALIHAALTRSEHFTLLEAKLATWLAASLLHLFAGEASSALDYATRCYKAAREQGYRRYMGYALLFMGHASTSLAQWPAAANAYTNALALYEALAVPPMIAEIQAGLARLALAQNQRATALAWAEKLLVLVEEQPFVGMDEPFQVYLTLYQVLTAHQDARGPAILARGINELYGYANKIGDSKLRASFLENVPSHRALCQAYSAAEATAITSLGHAQPT